MARGRLGYIGPQYLGFGPVNLACNASRPTELDVAGFTVGIFVPQVEFAPGGAGCFVPNIEAGDGDIAVLGAMLARYNTSGRLGLGLHLHQSWALFPSAIKIDFQL